MPACQYCRRPPADDMGSCGAATRQGFDLACTPQTHATLFATLFTLRPDSTLQHVSIQMRRPSSAPRPAAAVVSHGLNHASTANLLPPSPVMARTMPAPPTYSYRRSRPASDLPPPPSPPRVGRGAEGGAASTEAPTLTLEILHRAVVLLNQGRLYTRNTGCWGPRQRRHVISGKRCGLPGVWCTRQHLSPRRHAGETHGSGPFLHTSSPPQNRAGISAWCAELWPTHRPRPVRQGTPSHGVAQRGGL